ncbi:shikimate kinase [Tepidicaulis sp. LMO-SS28]|uniref:shikimate kinase n=1 Tax=Tepidicaulis sp. LMO-SS28 TaxID=3447455 RepID=UPI003EE3F532
MARYGKQTEAAGTQVTMTRSGKSTKPAPPPAPKSKDEKELAQEITALLGARSLVLIGLMGAGKTTIGKRLAQRLGLDFVDADAAIEDAAGETISEIFQNHGEQYFREGERRVIARLLDEGPQVLATGGGAFMDEGTRATISAKGISIWLHADLDVLVERVSRRGGRPLLKKNDPAKVMKELMEKRYPVYAQADITVDSDEASHDAVVDGILSALEAYMEGQQT